MAPVGLYSSLGQEVELEDLIYTLIREETGIQDQDQDQDQGLSEDGCTLEAGDMPQQPLPPPPPAPPPPPSLDPVSSNRQDQDQDQDQNQAQNQAQNQNQGGCYSNRQRNYRRMSTRGQIRGLMLKNFELQR